MTIPTTLQTSRLLLEPLTLSDAARTQELFPQWEIVQFLNARTPWPYPPDGALVYYRDIALPAVARGEEWRWTLRLTERPEEHIGAIGLIRGEIKNRGFWLGRQWQGRGLMTEAVSVVNDFWFDVLHMPVLRTPKAVANVGSRRISEKTGMRLVSQGEGDYVCGRLPSQVWEITAEQWRAKRDQLWGGRPGDEPGGRRNGDYHRR